MKIVVVGLGIVVAVTAALARAETVEERIERKEEAEWFERYIVDMNQACKSKIAGTWDWNSFGGKLKAGGLHVSTQCGTAVEGLKRLCQGTGDDVREVVRKNITTIQCRGIAPETGLELTGKTWVITTSVEQKRTDVQHFAQKFLEKNLK